MKQKILIIDDEKSIRDSIQMIFSKEFSVFTASEGKIGLEIIKQDHPLLIFLDIGMPGLSGFKVLEIIKKDNLPGIIWMLTGEENIDVALKTIQMGAAGYLTKPFDAAEIRNITLNVMQNHERKIKHDTSGDKPWAIEK